MVSTEDLAFALLSTIEGLRLTAYPDSGGVPSIGFGHTQDVKLGDTCIPDQAKAWLVSDAAPLFKDVANLPPVAAAAYISFGYNCGRSALLLVLEGKAVLTHFIHDRHGNVDQGLVNRRNLENLLIESTKL